MNIFVLDNDPKKAAQMLCDKHVSKMILETAQILCAVAHKNGISNVPYRLTHKNHPCTLWAGDTALNWEWLLTHGLAMSAEYTRRYKKIHKSTMAILWCKTNDTVQQSKGGQLTPHPQCMPPQYHAASPVDAYRAYYINEKAHIAKWAHSTMPSWWPVKQQGNR